MPTASCRDHFREIASRYRAVRSLDVRAVRRITKALARLVPAQGERGLRLLDVGTGTGRYLVALCEALRELGVPIAGAVGTDQSSAMLKRFTGLAVTARAEALPYGAAFDAVLTFNALHHLELDRFLAEAATRRASSSGRSSGSGRGCAGPTGSRGPFRRATTT